MGLTPAGLVVDSRVGSHDLIEPLKRLDLPVAAGTLTFGDVAFTGRGEADAPVLLGLEYKTLSDFVNSCRSERLQGLQAPGMAEMYAFRWLLIEGELLWNAKGMLLKRVGRQAFTPLHGHMTISEFHQRLHVLHLQYGLIPWLTSNRRGTLKWIESWYRMWTDKTLDAHRSHIGIYRPPSLAPITEFVRVVSGFDGISYELARRLERRFLSLDCFWRAGVLAWQEVEGIGPGKAQAIRAAQLAVAKR